MRDFSRDHSPVAINTATLGHNLDGHGAGWPPERVIDACAGRGFGGLTFWVRELDDRPAAIGDQVAGIGNAGYRTLPSAIPGRAGELLLAELKLWKL